MKSHWISHKGKRILFCDYSNCGVDGRHAKEEMDYVISLATAEPANSVMTLTDVRGTRGTPEMFDLMKATATTLTPYVKKRAVVGITGIQQTFLSLMNKVTGNKSFVLFDDLEKAKDWLAEG